ncbi:MAG: polyprenyl synthetase family protein [Bacteroidales bacterium]|nr:polyprenyl synthetase family protein [Bacteroidales bacterium]
MSEIEKIKAPIRQEMIDFNDFFKSSIKSKVPLLDIITNYILRRKGKQMRPLFVFLSAKMFGEINESSYTAASLIELLHTATLVHDDIVDESYERRGFFSINALWKSKAAVLVGDYLMAKGLLLSLENKEFELLEIASGAVKEISEGELHQIQKSRKLDINEEEYFEIIRKKTASLIAACTACGAKSVKADNETLEKMKLFGELVGIAFQIRDDLFDYQKNGLVGKPRGNDIKEKKLTLPIIHALDKSSKSEKRKILRMISRQSKNSKNLDEIIQFVRDQGGLEYSTLKMNEYRDKALVILTEFPDSEAKTSLIALVNYSIDRQK